MYVISRSPYNIYNSPFPFSNSGRFTFINVTKRLVDNHFPRQTVSNLLYQGPEGCPGPDNY